MIDIDFAGLGARVQRFRKMNGLSAEKLAELAGGGLTRPIVANIESGRRQDVSLSQLMCIAWALQVPPVALIFDLHAPLHEALEGENDGASLETVLNWMQAPEGVVDSSVPATPSGAHVYEILGNMRARQQALDRLSEMERSAATETRTAPEWIDFAKERGFWKSSLDRAEQALERLDVLYDRG